MNATQKDPVAWGAHAPFAIPDDQSAYLILVRHGATEANLREPPWLQGRGADLPLCDLGRRQAQAAATRLASIPIARVVASPLARADQTARIIAKQVLSGSGQHADGVESLPEIMECDVGRWEGLDWGTIARREPELHRRFMQDPAAHGYPDGESFAAVHRRAAPALDRLLEQNVGSVVVAVSHNVVNRTYLASMLGIPLGRARAIRQDNGCINLLRRHAGKTEVLSVNAVFHLMD